METKVAKLEDSPRWGRLIQWLRGGGEGGFLERQVVIEEGGEPVAVLMDPDTVQAAQGRGPVARETSLATVRGMR